MKRKKTITFMVIIASLATSFANYANAQDEIDERLWGSWSLDTVEIASSSSGAIQRSPAAVLLADRSTTPRNMFTALYFFGNNIGVNSTEAIFASDHEELNLKGTFAAKDGRLIITMRNEQPRTFTYEIDGELLTIKYTQDNLQLSLIFKLTIKHVG